MNAQITVSLQEFESFREKTKALEAEIIQLKTELEEARLGEFAVDDRRRLAEALCLALEVVQFGLGNLHPLTARGWPYVALRRLGTLLADCPGVPQTFRECARGDWGLLADEAERWEKARAEGREQEMLAEENAARGVPADHPLIRGAGAGHSEV